MAFPNVETTMTRKLHKLQNKVFSNSSRQNAQSHIFIVPWQSKNNKNVPYLRRSARQKKNTTSEEVWAALFPAQRSIGLTFSQTITRKMCSHQYLKFLRRRITSNLKRPSRYELFALLTQWKVMFFTISPRKWQNRRPGIKKSQTLRKSHSVIFFFFSSLYVNIIMTTRSIEDVQSFPNATW